MARSGSLFACTRYRQKQAPDLFLGAYIPGSGGRTLIGYVCSTLSPSDHLTHESMSEHVPDGTSVCVHAVCVTSDLRRRGVALGLLKEYIARLQNARLFGAPYERILLITHEDMRSLYEQAGFEWQGESKVVHGPDPWYEMRITLTPPPPPQSVPSGLWEALQRSSTRKVPVARLFASFAGGVGDLGQRETSSSEITNKFDLLCPRQGCGSIVLKNGVAALADRESVQIEPTPTHGGSSVLPELPSPGTVAQWWRVTPNAMAFENIGFSRTVVLDGKSSACGVLPRLPADHGYSTLR